MPPRCFRACFSWSSRPITAGRSSAQSPSRGDSDLGSRRELFVDRYLIEKLTGAALVAETAARRGRRPPVRQTLGGAFCGYATVIHDGPLYRLYYRGLPRSGRDGSGDEVTCYAESRDGIHWTKPELGLFEVAGSKANNVVLAGMPPFSHNFSPMIDTRHGVPPARAVQGPGGHRRKRAFRLRLRGRRPLAEAPRQAGAHPRGVRFPERPLLVRAGALLSLLSARLPRRRSPHRPGDLA